MLKFFIPASTSLFAAAAYYTDNLPQTPHLSRKAKNEVIAQSTTLNNQIRPSMEQVLSEYRPSWFYIHQALVIIHQVLLPAS